jgi:uracil-DNA glycosylase
MMVKIEKSWNQQLEEEFEKSYFKNLADFVRKEYHSNTIYPSGKAIFKAFDHCPFSQVKVVILGQDPYHGPGQANGLCFSVNDGIKKPPSLKNIFKEVAEDTGNPIPETGNLERWAKQGVLLLNATLTVRAKQPGSHQGQGWEEFTDAVVRRLTLERKNLVYLLWGSYAMKKGNMINRSENLVLEAPHPSPFSVHRGFFGCRHFSRCNEYLEQHGKSPINW